MNNPINTAPIDTLCEMLHDPEKRDAAKAELLARGTQALRPLLRVRLGPEVLFANDLEHMEAMSAIDAILVGNGRSALRAIKVYINGLEEPKPLDRQSTRDGHTVPTYIYAVNTADEIVDLIKEQCAVGESQTDSFRKTCPACGSGKVKVVIQSGADDDMQKFGNFKVFHDRECKDCGRRWTPPCPRWAAYCCIAAGVLILAPTIALAILLFMGDAEFTFLNFLGICGIFPLVYGIGTLAGKFGQLRMR